MAGQPDAVVLGGGPAGLLAAAALDRQGFAVLIVEQDAQPTETKQNRAGVPHGGQLHNLLSRGQRHLEELLPGYLDALIGAGGAVADVASQTHVYELGIRMPERTTGLKLLSAPRSMLESVARDLLPPTVKLSWSTRVLGLDLSGDCVVGVQTSEGDIRAGVVVDALGANSSVSRWSGELPDETTFAAQQWYSSLTFDRPRQLVGVPDFWLTFPSATGTRGGLISPLGTRRWSVSMSGRSDDPAPMTTRAFLDYARTLEDERIAAALQGAAPKGQPRTFGRPVARWRRFDHHERPRRGLLHIGDAVCALNPLLGQGISVAAWQASLLTQLAANGVDGIEDSFAAACSLPVSDAWDLTLIYQSDLTDDDWERIAQRVASSEDVHRQYVRMWHMLEPPATAAKIARGEGVS